MWKSARDKHIALAVTGLAWSLLSCGSDKSGPTAPAVVPVASVSVTLATSTIFVGQAVQLNAVVKDNGGSALTGRLVTWLSSDTTKARVSTTGLATAVAAGTATITATSEGKSGSATVTVNQVPVASVSLTLPVTSLGPNDTVRITATVRDDQGNTLSGRQVSWHSSDTTVLVVNSTGLVTSKTYEFSQPRSATITASVDGKSASGMLTQLKFSFADNAYLYIGYYNRRRYFLARRRDVWPSANATVKSFGNPRLNLATIKDPATNTFLAAEASRIFPGVEDYHASDQIMMIGAFYDRVQRGWRWVDGSSVSYQRFINSADDYLAGSAIVAAMMYAGGGNWNIATDLQSYWPVLDEQSESDSLPQAASSPLAYFDFTTNGCTPPFSASFRNLSVGATSSSLSFGDGSTSSASTASHTYSSAGPFVVLLTATNQFGSDTTSRVVNFKCATSYAAFNAGTLSLVPWEGQRVAILTRSGSYLPTTMSRMVANLDSAYSYYASITGAEPGRYRTYNGKLTIAQVPTSCGAGCGILGATGIEIIDYFFEREYGLVKLNPLQDDHVPYYEMGRNFWFYGSKLTFGTYSYATTGFAIHSQFGALQRAGVTDPNPCCWVWSQYASELRQQFNLYLADTTKNFANTLQVGQWSPPHTAFTPNANDLFASMLFKLQDLYGGEAFIKAFWRAVAARPDAVSIQGAVDNLVLAASAAANRNLTTVFQGWRFPVSAAAIAEAGSRW